MNLYNSVAPPVIRVINALFKPLLLSFILLIGNAQTNAQESPGYTGNSQNRIAPHAPDYNDPNYEVKKNEWIANYPEEYNALQPNGNQNTIVDVSLIPEASLKAPLLGPHAPDSDDPDFEAKKAEWIKNYPEEYNVLHRNSVITCNEAPQLITPSEIDNQLGPLIELPASDIDPECVDNEDE
ncbi:MAG: hypothetical protein KBB11_02210 [Bacteroidales bacterium]|nr:hypothetical protein [Bacteroidales bacterium]HOY40048.1 hypothetical protein [Bacteroidales bacterium]HQP03993.1 hypothetical protein [Bacteroidales bacterium]